MHGRFYLLTGVLSHTPSSALSSSSLLLSFLIFHSNWVLYSDFLVVDGAVLLRAQKMSTSFEEPEDVFFEYSYFSSSYAISTSCWSVACSACYTGCSDDYSGWTSVC